MEEVVDDGLIGLHGLLSLLALCPSLRGKNIDGTSEWHQLREKVWIQIVVCVLLSLYTYLLNSESRKDVDYISVLAPDGFRSLSSLSSNVQFDKGLELRVGSG